MKLDRALVEQAKLHAKDKPCLWLRGVVPSTITMGLVPTPPRKSSQLVNWSAQLGQLLKEILPVGQRWQSSNLLVQSEHC